MRFLTENDSNFVRERFEKELVEDVTVTVSYTHLTLPTKA